MKNLLPRDLWNYLKVEGFCLSFSLFLKLEVREDFLRGNVFIFSYWLLTQQERVYRINQLLVKQVKVGQSARLLFAFRISSDVAHRHLIISFSIRAALLFGTIQGGIEELLHCGMSLDSNPTIPIEVHSLVRNCFIFPSSSSFPVKQIRINYREIKAHS